MRTDAVRARAAVATTATLLLLGSCAAGDLRHPSSPGTRPCPGRGAFLIAPVLGGIGFAEFLEEGARYRDAGFDSAQAVRALLEEIEPGGPGGEVELGYTLVVPLLSLFARSGDGWRFDEERADFYLDLVVEVGRPAVVYLLGNHFTRSPDAEHSLAEALLEDPVNVMVFADGQRPGGRYFATDVKPFTLSADERIPVNRYRFGALREMTSRLLALDREHPGLVRAITLGGEIHHLFPDLEHGTGRYEDVRFTDYSDLAVREFRAWLAERYASAATLDRETGTDFASLADAVPPSADIRHQRLRGYWDHVDAYADGRLPVFGWVHARSGTPSVEIHLDGRRVGEATTGLNRLDVYEAVEAISDPNVGFRYDLDFSQLAPGIHELAVAVADPGGGRRLLGVRRIVVMTPDQSPPRSDWSGDGLGDAWPPLAGGDSDTRGSLDHPRDLQDLYFNPYARLWQRFREFQSERFLRKLWEIATGSGFDAERVFSHQLLPALNGSWNDLLFAAGATLREDSPYRPGLTLYGGLTASPLALARTFGRPYGVPEFHPLLDRDPAAHRRALRFHADACAVFVSPYHMNVYPPGYERPPDGHEAMEITPDNPARGSAFLFQALAEMVTR